MELRELKTFRAVAKTLNFTQAAAQLGYAQSSITAQIQSLEEELSVQLFNRLGRRVVLSESGQQLLRYAEKILDLEEEARTTLSGAQTTPGTLCIGAPESVCTYRLPIVIEAFRQAMPHMQIILKPLFYLDLSRHLKEGWIDLAFFLEDYLTSQNLHIETLRAEAVLLVAHPHHPLAQAASIQPCDLETETLLLTERGCGYRSKFERVLSAAGVHPSMILEFGSVETIKQCAIAGLGVALLPQATVATALQAGTLVALNWSEPFEIYTQLSWHKDKWLSPSLRTFADLSRSLLGVES